MRSATDTSAGARRALSPYGQAGHACTCARPMNAEHRDDCAWWRNDWTKADPSHPARRAAVL
jgi:hypothetical protein